MEKKIQVRFVNAANANRFEICTMYGVWIQRKGRDAFKRIIWQAGAHEGVCQPGKVA